MNNIFLEQSLSKPLETEVKVSAELHQDIMRAVRLAGPAAKKSPGWTIPAWGAGLAVTVITVFYLAHTTGVAPLPASNLVQSQGQGSAASLVALGDKLAAFTETTPLPEKELRQELERLKSDLGRFDFRS